MSLRTENKLIVAAVFILLEIAAVVMLRSSSVLQDIWINRFSHRTLAVLWGWTTNVRAYFSLVDENERLASENFALNEQLRAYQETERILEENSAVNDRGGRFHYIPATVVKSSSNTMHNYIILNKGAEDGVNPYSGIITQKGVVGIVCAVDRHYSYGLTLMNNNVSVSARIGANGNVVPLVWDGRKMDGAYVKDLPLHEKVMPMDTVFTSGYSEFFPEGIPIGLTGASTVVDGASCRTEVLLFQDFSALKYVTIVENPDRAEIFFLEQQSQNK